MTGQLTVARARTDGSPVPEPDVRAAMWASIHGREMAGTETGVADTARPLQDADAVDAGWLVRQAAEGSPWAWECLIHRYNRLIWAMTHNFKLTDNDAADIVQVTWLRLFENIDRLEHPSRVGSWLATTARHECLRSVAARKRLVLVDDDALSDVAAHQAEVDERVIADERARAVRQALSRLPRSWQLLLELLMADPPASYAEISDQLGLPIGSIGPTRGRCLAKLRVLLQASWGSGDDVVPIPALEIV